MAVLRVPDENRTLTSDGDIRAYLAARGIEYARLAPVAGATSETPADELLRAYAPVIDELKARGGYVTADVIDVKADTPNLDAMLKRFSSEHWHDEDEVRLIVEGRGLFHIHPAEGAVFAIEVERGRSDSACRRARTTGSTSAASGASAPSGCSRTSRAGRRITRRAASTPSSSRCASVRCTSRRRE